jgi:hypothetical protein
MHLASLSVAHSEYEPSIGNGFPSTTACVQRRQMVPPSLVSRKVKKSKKETVRVPCQSQQTNCLNLCVGSAPCFLQPTADIINLDEYMNIGNSTSVDLCQKLDEHGKSSTVTQGTSVYFSKI